MATVQKEEALSDSISLISWSIDTTGRRISDEMCQIGAFSRNVNYKQYVMPYKNLDKFAKKRHFLNTTVVRSRFRILKDTLEGRSLKTKSEYAALNEFIHLLEEKKKKIVLVIFEPNVLAPHILLESLKRYGLLTKFSEYIKGFCNCYDFVKAKCEKTMTVNSLRDLARILLNKENEKIHDAFERAKLTYEVLEHLCTGDTDNIEENILQNLSSYITSIEDEEKRIASLKDQLSLQQTLKPIFAPVFSSPKDRKRGVDLRRQLVAASVDYRSLAEQWEQEKDVSKMGSFLKEKVNQVPDQDIEELCQLIAGHFKISTENPPPVTNNNETKPAENI